MTRFVWKPKLLRTSRIIAWPDSDSSATSTRDGRLAPLRIGKSLLCVCVCVCVYACACAYVKSSVSDAV